MQNNSTDWKRIKADATQEAAIHCDEHCELYDPNDADSVSAYWHQCNIKHSPGSPEMVGTRHKPATTSQATAKGSARNLGIDMSMHNPAHPGELLAGWLKDLHIDLATFAVKHGISATYLSRVAQSTEGITVDMDRLLTTALGTTPGYWLSLQNQRDLWIAQMDTKANATRPISESDGESA